jgi:DNA repair protein RadD
MMMRASEKGKKSVMLVRGVHLVEQASQRLFREHVPHGVRQGNHWNKNHHAPIQICSIDTLRRRQDFPEADLLVIDEAHLMTSKKDVEYILHYKRKGAFILAVSATPYVRESLRHLADAVVSPITMLELVSQGYLVPIRYFAPSAPDLRGVHSRDGDWVAEELASRMQELTGGIVSHWKQHASDRPTVGFAASIKHAQFLSEQCNASGIASTWVEGDHTLTERSAEIEKLRTGELKILWSVGTLCTGVDIPFLGAIIMARPTKSYNLYVQQVGRGTRTFPGKEDCLLLDHAGNVLRHGFVTDEPEVDLDGMKKDLASPKLSMCPTCFIPFRGECPACGFRVPPPARTEAMPTEDSGVLKELAHLPKAVEISIYIRRMKELAKRRGYKTGWVYHAVKEKYGEDVAREAFPSKHRQVSWISRVPQSASR